MHLNKLYSISRGFFSPKCLGWLTVLDLFKDKTEDLFFIGIQMSHLKRILSSKIRASLLPKEILVKIWTHYELPWEK